MNFNALLRETIATSCEMGIKYGERLATGIPPEQFARLAAPGGVSVQSNHPSFVYGHLSLYPVRILQALGASTVGFEPTEEFLKVFDRTCQCVDDPQGTIYPPMEAVLQQYRSSYTAAAQAIRNADLNLLAAENTNEAMRARFPSQAAMFNFYLSGHVMMHLGQISAWRRMMGMSAA
jgi:hypothetical protein